MFTGAARNGLTNRLTEVGVPYGLARCIAEANYPPSDPVFGPAVSKRGARKITQDFLEYGVGSLEGVVRSIFAETADDVAAFARRVEADAVLIGNLRRSKMDS